MLEQQQALSGCGLGAPLTSLPPDAAAAAAAAAACLQPTVHGAKQTVFDSEFSLTLPCCASFPPNAASAGAVIVPASPPKLMAAEAGGQGAAQHLLDLPEDVLLRIGLHLKLHERLQLAGVCRKLRQLCAGPSELWRVLQVVLRGEEGEEAALRQLVCFRRQARLGSGLEVQTELSVQRVQAALPACWARSLGGGSCGAF